MSSSRQLYHGRFAPSPTGTLHFGSLLAAVASYLQAKRNAGRWLIRIDDIDPQREVTGSAAGIVRDLAAFGMHPDLEVDYQHRRLDTYRAACEGLVQVGRAYPCGCSRADLPPDSAYPGTCRNGLSAGKQARSVRIRTSATPLTFDDVIQGVQTASIEAEHGDFVIWRADDLPSYQLATAMDDATPGITEVVRGADLLDSTFRQIHVQHALGLGTPVYAHLPVATRSGVKLSKRLASDPLTATDRVQALYAALHFLGQHPPRGRGFADLWAWAVDAWDISRVPAVRAMDAPTNGGKPTGTL
jgi:glutamyl-Q tRNA(Asp) synthetase